MKRSKLIITSYIAGILSVALNWVLCWLPVFSQIVCMALGTAAVILGILGKKKEPDKKGLAIAGIVLGAIGFAYGLVALFACGLAAYRTYNDNAELMQLIESVNQ